MVRPDEQRMSVRVGFQLWLRQEGVSKLRRISAQRVKISPLNTSYLVNLPRDFQKDVSIARKSSVAAVCAPPKGL